MRALAFLAAILGSCAIPSCAEPPAAPPASVVATTGMVADIARAVGGDRVRVEALMGPGVDPHLYKPTRSDVQRLLAGDLILYNGLLLEGRMTDTLVRAASAGKLVKAVADGIDETSLLEPEQMHGHADPHVWMDPRLWSSAVDAAAQALSARDPDGAQTFAANADAYKARLGELDEYAQRVLASVPEGQRVLVTAHDAFNYFGRRYGFEVVGLQGISTESEAGLRDIERLVSLLVDRKIKAVFVESTVSERGVSALIAGAKARGHDVVIGGTLFSDAMGLEGSYEGTYIGMIDHNVTTITRALGGEAPPRGMRGELAP